MGLGLIANCLPVAIAACSKNPQNPTSGTSQNSVSSNSTEFRQIGTIAQLDKEGRILNQQIADKPILVVRDATKPDMLVAVNPTCTHRDCLVEWKKDKNVFGCACHESEFDTTGKVLNPPAEDPLTVYAVKIEGDLVLVSNASGVTG
jgi:cytochrome b6-f complex iron-sulfur subunit